MGRGCLKSSLAGMLVILGALLFMASIALFVFGTETAELLGDDLQYQIGVILGGYDPTLVGIGALIAGVSLLGWGLSMMTST